MSPTIHVNTNYIDGRGEIDIESIDFVKQIRGEREWNIYVFKQKI